MIALVEQQYPKLGIIYLPVYDTLYFNTYNGHSYKYSQALTLLTSAFQEDFLKSLLKNATTLPCEPLPKKFTILQSKSHFSKQDEHYLKLAKAEKKEVGVIIAGSCLKYTYLAEGKAHEYTRFNPMKEWDVGAGHAIVENAGVKVTSIDNNSPLAYNSKEVIIPNFKCSWE